MTASTTPVRTRFAPSPTGFLHLGGARTALFSWAFARHYGGAFILRIEDTDLARSTQEAVQAILDGMEWLGLEHDEEIYYQMARVERHKECIQKLLDEGKAYYCYSAPEEVEAMREKARAEGRKPKYDGTWRPEEGKVLPPVPEGVKPVVRFKNPQTGSVVWNDLVKGEIRFENEELDDLIIARPDGTPTYNFCVVVDDWDMQITHVLRGDDHVNNTPRQINILKALGAPVPVYGHIPMILGPDGQKLSKRHGAVSVMSYKDDGYLPEAMLNYLARLGWSHGDDELFTREQLVAWFDEHHMSKSAAQWDPKKLNWVNAHYIKQRTPESLATEIAPRITALGGTLDGVDLPRVVALFQDRAETLVQLAESCLMLCRPFTPADPELQAQHLTPEAKVILADFAAQAAALPEWTAEALHTLIQDTLAKHSIKMPKLGIPLRLAVVGQKNTPSVDQVLAVLGRDVVLARLAAV